MAKQNKPAIRFKGFTDAWEQRKAKDLCSISTGKSNTQDRVDDGIYPFYVRSPIVEHSNRYLFDEEAVLTVGDGVGTGKVFHYVNGKYDLHQRVYRMFDFSEEITAKYFYYYFSNHFYDRVMAMTAKTSVDSVRYEMIADMDIALPKVKEQMAISAYFDRLDHLITLHQRKLEKLKELRKGVMKKLFNQEVRFKADDESEFPEWEKKKIGDVFSQIKYKNKDGRNQNVITNSAEFGLINQRDFFDKDIAVDGKTENYTVIKTGDFVYNPRKSKQAPYGPFNCYKLEENGIVSPLYTCLRPKSNVNDKYLLWYFKSGSWHRFIYENGAQNGARHDRVGMTDSLMQEIPVYLPQAVEEQQKIADCLLSLDDVIAKQKATLVAWEELKKGLLQQMFV